MKMAYPGQAADDVIQRNLSKMRFLQTEAISWLLPTKLIELMFAGGVLLLVIPFFVDEPIIDKLPYAGVIFMIVAYFELAKRRAIWWGFYYGYEQGFKDAATANFDFWGTSHDEHSDAAAVEAIIDRIKEAEEKVGDENLAMRDKQIIDGLKRCQGFVVRWWRAPEKYEKDSLG